MVYLVYWSISGRDPWPAALGVGVQASLLAAHAASNDGQVEYAAIGCLDDQAIVPGGVTDILEARYRVDALDELRHLGTGRRRAGPITNVEQQLDQFTRTPSRDCT